MDVLEVIETIKDYKKRGGNWFTMAELIREVSRSAAWVGHYPSNSAWLKAAAEASGYRPTVVRRMLRVTGFLDRMVVLDGSILPEGSDIPLASLEILDRMYPLSPVRVNQLVGRAIRGEVTLREVQKEYDELVSKKPAQAGDRRMVPRLTRTFELSGSEAVIKSVALFSGKGNFETVKKFNGPFGVSDHLISIQRDSTSNAVSVDGFRFKFVPNASELSDSAIFPYLTHVAFHSSFFRRYWLIFSDGPGADFAERIYRNLSVLELYNVGIAILKEKEDASTVENTWIFPGSAFNPEICLPEEPGFFPSEAEYAPRWKHLLLEYVSQHY